MPPTRRKATGPAQGNTAAADPTEATAPAQPAPTAETPPAEDATTTPARPATEPATANGAPQEADGEPTVVPTEPTYHWQDTNGTATPPCRACAPAGPPPTAGSFGCAHGQWVRVPDAD